MKIKNNKGFTILELVIASSVFGVIMLIAMTGILYIGRTYYKGIVTSKTQETARSIAQEITNSFQYGGSTPATDPVTASFSGFNVKTQCIGNFRYSYIIGSRISGVNDSSVPTSKHALWLDVIKEGSECVPIDLTSSIPEDDKTDKSPGALAQRRELLPTNMRLDRFSFQQPSGRSFLNVDVNVIYGIKELSPNGVCIPNREGGQFCARSALTTTVKKRI